MLEGVDELLHFVRAVLDKVGEVAALEAHSENAERIPNSEFRIPLL